MNINNDEGFNAYIDINGDDKFVESRVDYNNRSTVFTFQNDNVSYIFIEDNNIDTVRFDKNGINVVSNSGGALNFTDKTSTLNVTFTVAELIALKALLPTT